MYADGTLDLMMMIALAAFKPPEEKQENLNLIVKKAKARYFPVFEKVGSRDPVWIAARPYPGVADRPGCSRERHGPAPRLLRAQVLLGKRGGAGIFKRPPVPPPIPERNWGRDGRELGDRAQATQVPTSPSQEAGVQDLLPVAKKNISSVNN